MKEFAKKFYNSKSWRDCRNGYIQHRMSIDGGFCEVCHDSLGYIVHHKEMITPENISNPYVTLNWNNLQYVCKECHDKLDGHGVVGTHKQKEVRYLWDEDGRMIPIAREE